MNTATFTATLTAKKLLSAVALLAAATGSMASCWTDAAKTYDVPESVLKAVAKTESNFNPKALNVNSNKSYDLGIMQINTVWLPTLKSHGITRKDLWDECTNIKVGAWILAGNASRLGWNWDAIGAYNAGCRGASKATCDARRAKYTAKIYKALMAQKKGPVSVVTATAPRTINMVLADNSIEHSNAYASTYTDDAPVSDQAIVKATVSDDDLEQESSYE